MAKKIKPKDLRAMSEEELKERIVTIKQELSKERALISSGTRPENPGIIRKNRREIARTLTILNEIEIKKKPEVSKSE